MKDILIPAKRQKAEMKWIVACFCLAFLVNVIAIFIYKTSWSEVYTQFLWVLILTCVFYGLSVVLRVLFVFVKRLFS